ncbi:carbohydrate kinase family protein, partial [Agromyces seonyuensis]|nr:hypothetical protein [Agromyces seonyuensis]
MAEADGSPRPRFVVVGDVIDDVLVVPDGAIRPDTDTAAEIRTLPGGAAANTAAWLGATGADVDFVGIVGAGDADRHAALLDRHGVRAHLAAHPALPTGTIVVLVDGEHRTMLASRGANAVLDPDALGDDLLAGAAVVYATGHALAGDTDPAAFGRLVARARAAGALVVAATGSA